MKRLPMLVALAFASLAACGNGGPDHDASGVFESREILISAEVPGQILEMPIEEGQALEVGAIAARIDCTQLELQREQIRASEAAISDRTTEAKPQIEVLREQQKSVEKQLGVQKQQLVVLGRERERFAKLVAAKAAPAKQLADIEGQMAILEKQIESTRSQIAVFKQQVASTEEQVALQNRATRSETQPTQARIALIEAQIAKCKVDNPIAGTVLRKYAEVYEFATAGKPLYKVADLSEMTLRAYVTGDQLERAKLGSKVKVFIDKGKDDSRELAGEIAWVSELAEFTPKTIQTKEERANLVYAMKVTVPNDGSLKIGMYGEVDLP